MLQGIVAGVQLLQEVKLAGSRVAKDASSNSNTASRPPLASGPVMAAVPTSMVMSPAGWASVE